MPLPAVIAGLAGAGKAALATKTLGIPLSLLLGFPVGTAAGAKTAAGIGSIGYLAQAFLPALLGMANKKNQSNELIDSFNKRMSMFPSSNHSVYNLGYIPKAQRDAMAKRDEQMMQLQRLQQLFGQQQQQQQQQ